MKQNKIKAYMCGTDWFTEMGLRQKNFPELYKTMAALKRDRECWRDCGIVEVELKLVKVKKKGTI